MLYTRSSHRYALIFTDAKSGLVHGELPAEAVTQDEVLNLPGGITFSMPLDTRQATIITAETLAPWRTIVYLARDESVLGCGAFVVGYQASVGSNTLTVTALGIGEYFRHRFLRQDLQQIGVDQTLIVKALIDYAQGQSGGNLGVTTTYVTATGVLRDRTDWFAYARRNIGQLIEDLANTLDGFNFRYRSRRSGQVYVTDLITQYPATGRVTNFVFELGGNVEVLDTSVDGKDMANLAEAVGGGNQDTAPISTAINADSLNSTVLLERIETFSSVSEPSTLDQKARRALSFGAQPISIPTLRISPDAEPTIGQYNVGDRVRVRGVYGLLSVDAEYLITQTKVVVSPKAEYVDINVAPVTAVATI